MGIFIDFKKFQIEGKPVPIQDVLQSGFVPEFAIGILYVQEVEHPSIRSHHFIFPHCEITLGRLTSNDIVTYNSYSSRKHATVYSDIYKVFVQDLESLNGTYLNGKMIHSVQQLENDDVIELGGSRAVFKRF